MADPAPSYEEVLAARYARAREAMAAYLRRFAGAPRYPLSVFHPLGGFVLDRQGNAARRLPGLWRALRDNGIGRSAHSFGGEYLVADPYLYVKPPPWIDRRRRIDRRVRLLLAALPDRVERSRLDFASWLGLMVALDVLRTDLCSILWNELAIADAGAADAGAVAGCEEALAACIRATLELLAPLDADPAAGDRRADLIFLAGRIRVPSDLSSEPPGLAEDTVRALRASDNTFLVWASLALLAAERAAPTGPCWAIGNGFGGIDLGYFAAATLAALGVDALPGTCRAGGHGAPRAEPDRARWPSGRHPRTVLFCDDSVSSGGTFRAFRRFCRRTVPSDTVEAFVLTYDLGARRDDEDAERERFGLARHATTAAPWSPSPHPKPGPPRHLRDLLAGLRGSSDERLRWLAESDAASVAALNEAPR